MAKELKKKTKTVPKATTKSAKVAKASAKARASVKVAVPKAKRGSKRSVELKKVAKEKVKATKKSDKKGIFGVFAKGKIFEKGKRRWLIGLVALVLAITGGITAAVCLWNHETPVETVQESEPEPEPEPESVGPAEGNEPLVPEVEMEDWSAYTVAPNKPRFLTIPAIGLYNIPIIEVGVTSAGAMGAPNSSFTVGWYYRSAYPGRVGKWATVIDGHGGSLGDGIFKELPRLVAGNEITIEMGDGRVFTYVVTEMVFKDKGSAADAYMKVADRPVDAETPTLTLITCTGAWIRAEQTYAQRLFVRAVLKN